MGVFFKDTGEVTHKNVGVLQITLLFYLASSYLNLATVAIISYNSSA